MTHYITAFTRTNDHGQEAACGDFVPADQHSTEPTCYRCRAWLNKPTPVNGDGRERIYRTAIRQIADRRTVVSPTFQSPVTSIVRDMGQTAREVGIVELLLEHQRIILAGALGPSYDLVEEALLRLGVTSKEILANLRRSAPDANLGDSGPVTGPDPRD